MSRYDDLAQVTRIHLEMTLEKHRRSRAESDRLDAERGQIDALRHAAQQDGGAVTARQILGADTLWQGWLARRRAEIQRQSALARALEEETRQQARLAFSRNAAAQRLIEEDRVARQRRIDQAEADGIDALGQLRRAMDGPPQEPGA
jgi:hypothetical protein